MVFNSWEAIDAICASGAEPNSMLNITKMDKCGMTGKNVACPAADSAEVVERSDENILRR